VVAGLAQRGVKWIQFDEPSLVRDLDAKDKEFFRKLYQQILAKKDGVKILLQTYFGDVRDIYEELTALDFDGIGLDFVEGKQTADLIEKYGFPKEKLLFAGLVNGKNIWRNHYSKTLATLDALKAKGINVVLSTSCSLLHVPYTLEGEDKLSENYKKHFAYAVEKLGELKELSALAEDAARENNAAYQKNEALFKGGRDCADAEVQKRLAQIKESDYVRLPERKEREKIQKAALQLPKFPTTTIGSFPQTKDVKKNRSAFRKGEITEEQYKAFNKDKIKRAIAWQEEIGLDVLVHGEPERNDMVEYFGELLAGFAFTKNGWVQSYGSRCVKPPIIFGDVARPAPMTVGWSSYAQSLTDKPVKGMLTGPVTILQWSFVRDDQPREQTCRQLALALRDEVVDLEAAGISVIQIDEPAIREGLPLRRADWQAYLDWAVDCFRLSTAGVRDETQIHTHMCYSEFNDIIESIAAMDADVITIETSRSNMELLKAFEDFRYPNDIGPGVYDIHSPNVPEVDWMVGLMQKAAARLPKERLWVNPDCGLKTRAWPETEAALSGMVQAA
ncbi:MAG: 5-methyltetrahydropteroyltriglutamate--homocysteine S-methyltransferase, partial [Firmicutes bacterium]|nr:5-methyltetrahydropteroyltriglutamate--homocysteine S-methyltransferase [Bacillota bacterium]